MEAELPAFERAAGVGDPEQPAREPVVADDVAPALQQLEQSAMGDPEALQMLAAFQKALANKRAAVAAATTPVVVPEDDSGMQLPSGAVDVGGNGPNDAAEPAGQLSIEEQQVRLDAEHKAACAIFEQDEAASLAARMAKTADFDTANKARLLAKAELAERAARRAAAASHGADATDGSSARQRSRSLERERRGRDALAPASVKVEVIEVEGDSA